MKRGAKIGVLAVMVVFTVGFIVIRGPYGCMALMHGRNPLRMVRATKEGVEESKQRGDAIIAAIEAYKRDNGEYPNELGALAPRYLAAVEEPTVGSCKWEYRRDQKKGFVLKHFFGPMYENQWYEGAAGKWFVDM